MFSHCGDRWKRNSPVRFAGNVGFLDNEVVEVLYQRRPGQTEDGSWLLFSASGQALKKAVGRSVATLAHNFYSRIQKFTSRGAVDTNVLRFFPVLSYYSAYWDVRDLVLRIVAGPECASVSLTGDRIIHPDRLAEWANHPKYCHFSHPAFSAASSHFSHGEPQPTHTSPTGPSTSTFSNPPDFPLFRRPLFGRSSDSVHVSLERRVMQHHPHHHQYFF